MAKETNRFSTQCYRALRLLVHILYGVGLSAFLFFIGSSRYRNKLKKRWSHQLLRILNLKLSADLGHVSIPPSCMLVSNHISWLDIVIINAVCPASFVAKSEIRRWPFVGWLAARNGTLFIHRHRRGDTQRIRKKIVDALSEGQHVAIYPEGGTSDGTRLKKFHANLLQAAIDAKVAIQPLAIQYKNANPDSKTMNAAVYIDDMTLWESFRRILKEPVLRAELKVLPLLQVEGKKRRELAEKCEELIAHSLGLPLAHKQLGRH